MLKIAIICIISTILYVIFKNKSPEFSLIVSSVGGLLILFLLVDYINEIINYFVDLNSNLFIEYDILKIVFKILSVSYLTEFVADFANDFGNTSIASKAVLGGKIVICLITLPVIKNLFSLLFSFC